jgi:hypothetical protein
MKRQALLYSFFFSGIQSTHATLIRGGDFCSKTDFTNYRI